MRFRTQVITGISVALIGAEVAARVLGFGNPILYRASPAGYEFVPGQSTQRLGKSTTINSFGTRGPEVERVAPAGTSRILVLGDSVANGGTQVDDDQTWPMQLRTRLNQQGRAVDVLNASVGGWSLPNEAAWLEEHGTFDANLVIVEVNEKDLDQTFVGPDLLDNNVSYPSHYPATALGEILTRYILPRFGLGSLSADPGSTSGAFQPQNTSAVFASLDRIRTLAEARKADVVFLYWDLRQPAPAEVIPTRERLMNYAAEHGIRVVRPDLNRDGNGAHLFRDDVHPNAEGNAVIAALLARDLF